jgi:hypothetical protein
MDNFTSSFPPLAKPDEGIATIPFVVYHSLFRLRYRDSSYHVSLFQVKHFHYLTKPPAVATL